MTALSARCRGHSRAVRRQREAQCLTRDQVFDLGEIIGQPCIPVRVFGLRTDFRGELSPGSQWQMPWADEFKRVFYGG